MMEPLYPAKEKNLYPKRYKPDKGIDEWLYLNPWKSLEQQLKDNGGVMPYEKKRQNKRSQL